MIDVNFDFTSEIPGYWEGYWDRNGGIGGCDKYDPDALSPTLCRYHQELWSRRLPNDEFMQLKKMGFGNYLEWKGFFYSSDSIIVSFRYESYRKVIEEVYRTLPDYKAYFEDFTRKSYSIPGIIIFPCHRNSINQARGINSHIRDRWDLTLECIRRYYNGETSPLYKVLCADKPFFDLFVDFRGYVDYFFLNDCVSEDYDRVDIWTDNFDFAGDALPKDVDEYFDFMERQNSFREKRRDGIKKHIEQWMADDR